MHPPAIAISGAVRAEMRARRTAEAIASEQGLGYRIFLVRRFLAMDVILTYVIWITILAFAIDWVLKTVSRRAFPWMEAGL